MFRIAIILQFISLNCLAQGNGFPFGQTTYKELEMIMYEKDTSAVAVVLNEFGEAYIDNEGNHNLIFSHHYKIKILKREGLKYADIIIPLAKGDKYFEKIRTIKAASYSLENNQIKEALVDKKSFFNENVDKDYDLKKFTIPNVRVGSIIEVHYELETPFFWRNFKKWEFQSTIPKEISEYWATIPGNYLYHISLRGFLKLEKNESEVIKDGFDIGDGYKANCARYKYSMQNIPAFIEEDFMTAKKNFIASINFELMEFRDFKGGIDKITTDWKNADSEMKNDQRFGIQLKKGKDLEQKIKPLVIGITDSLEKAKLIFDIIKGWYTWNDYYGKYSDLGLKKAFENKTGNVGDINLSLIAALRSVGLNADPLVLSSRENGNATEIFPVLSDFNYVIAKLDINKNTYLLDATDPFLPFGLIPQRCLNGKGRVFGSGPSYWYEIKPTDKRKTITTINLLLNKDGDFTGIIENLYSGYDAYSKRKEIRSFSSTDEYSKSMQKDFQDAAITNLKLEGLDDFNSPIKETFTIEIEGNINASTILFNPFLVEKLKKNPFHSQERLYPVDFGTPIESIISFTLKFPESLEITDLPQKTALLLPSKGGKFLFDMNILNNMLTMNYSLQISRSVYDPTEYKYLKELFSRIIQIQQGEIVLSKKI